jgi:hypothetical protein
MNRVQNQPIPETQTVSKAVLLSMPRPHVQHVQDVPQTDLGPINSVTNLGNHLARLVVLFGLVYLFSGIIPKPELDQTTRLHLAFVVVLIYSLLDIIKTLFKSAIDFTCTNVC